MNVHVHFTGYSLTAPRRHPVFRPRVLVADIQRAVADHFNLPVREMWSKRRARDAVRPRQIAMYLAREITTSSLPEIGRRFGNRDHTTVIHALRQVEKLRLENPEIDHAVSLLLDRFAPL